MKRLVTPPFYSEVKLPAVLKTGAREGLTLGTSNRRENMGPDPGGVDGCRNMPLSSAVQHRPGVRR